MYICSLRALVRCSLVNKNLPGVYEELQFESEPGPLLVTQLSQDSDISLVSK